MVKLKREEFDNQPVPLSKLISLEDAHIEDADLAQRRTDPKHIEELRYSNPDEWPPILVAATDKGYVVIDGYHRWEATDRDEIRATCKPFGNEQDIIEACFESNLRHGVGLNTQSRSNYAYFLHRRYPNMTQEEIGKRCHISQAAVSKAIARRYKARSKPEAKSQEQQNHEAIQQSLHSLKRDARKFLDSISKLSEAEQRAAILESIESIEEREQLLQFARRLEEILQPPKRRGK